MSSTTTIRFGGQDYTIRALTFGQMRDVGIGSAKATRKTDNPADREADFFNSALEVIRAALSRDNPEMTLDKIIATETTFQEIVDAHRAILGHAGLIANKPADAAPDGGEPVEGEVTAAASTGSTSTVD